ncbi:MAG: hypothetical protein HY368_02570 [Candidatus Aenigmarchaeota archaeon]|nr:hypothetical protein [Candidatus Aenigmarchaeota archaeon]
MARAINGRDNSSTLDAAVHWLKACLIEDRSIFSKESLWTTKLADEVYHAFVEHPDFGDDDFLTKLKGQMKSASPQARQLMAEMLWALLLFPSNIRAKTKRRQVREIWALSGKQLAEDHPLLGDNVLFGIGSGGQGFNNYRPVEMEYLIALTRDIKRRDNAQRQGILTDYDSFIDWIGSVPMKGSRQIRHMLRYFAFPDRVESISSNNDRRKILEAFEIAPLRDTKNWTDQQLDDALLKLRANLQQSNPTVALDFYRAPLKERWGPDRNVKTVEGKITVTVPSDDDEQDDNDSVTLRTKAPDARQSIQVQAKLAEIGAKMGLKIWIPRGDRNRVRELISENQRSALLEDLPLNYDETTLDTIEQIDVLWLKRRSIVQAFEVEHTTAVYSGLLRMADLLALQPNMEIRLHIVAPDERREKVFSEMRRPVFSLLERGPMSRSCTFISYDSVYAISSLEYLPHTNEGIITEYEEKADA